MSQCQKCGYDDFATEDSPHVCVPAEATKLNESQYCQICEAMAREATKPTMQDQIDKAVAITSTWPDAVKDAVSYIPRGEATKLQEPDDSITQYMKGVYAFLESNCPAGFADEVFRLPPSPTRSQELLLHAIQSDETGERLGLAQQDSGDKSEDSCAVSGVTKPQEPVNWWILQEVKFDESGIPYSFRDPQPCQSCLEKQSAIEVWEA